MKLTYEQLKKSRDSWKNIARGATMYLKVINGGDADRNLLISEIAKLSEWNAKHIEENDKLKLEIADLEQALTGRTVSCGQCDTLAKQIKDLQHQMKERDCFACNSFLTGSGWCDRHKAMLNSYNPIVNEIKFKAADDNSN